MLEIKDIESGYRDLMVLKGVNLEIAANSIAAVIGPNGSGKSTLIKCICGLLKVKRGNITFNGSKIENLPPHKIAQIGVSYVPQGKRLFESMTVRENLEIGAYLVKDKKQVKDRIEEVLEIFPELKERMQKKATFLSGGEQQTLLLARCLMNATAIRKQPTLLLLDEPSLGLQPSMVEEIYKKIEGIKKQPNSTILLVEQNVSMALSVADYFYVVNEGKIVYNGKCDKVDIEKLKEVYF